MTARWIPVTERLPEGEDAVSFEAWCLDADEDHPGPCVMGYDSDAPEGERWISREDTGCWEPGEVTHWRPRSKGPGEQTMPTCTCGRDQITMPLADAQMLLAWMDETFGNDEGLDWQDEDAAAVGDALHKAIENFKAMRAAVSGVPAAPAQSGLLQQVASGIEALDAGHDPLCMAVLRGKECTCGVRVEGGTSNG